VSLLQKIKWASEMPNLDLVELLLLNGVLRRLRGLENRSIF